MILTLVQLESWQNIESIIIVLLAKFKAVHSIEVYYSSQTQIEPAHDIMAE